MQDILENYFVSTLTEQTIENFILNYDIKSFVLNVLYYEKFDDNTKCQLMSKIVNAVNFDINSYKPKEHPFTKLCTSDNNLNLVKFLVENLNADINVIINITVNRGYVMEEYGTPIMNAFYHGCMKIVKYLYEIGANLDYQMNGSTNSIICYARDNLNTEYVSLIYDLMVENRKNKNEIDTTKIAIVQKSDKLNKTVAKISESNTCIEKDEHYDCYDSENHNYCTKNNNYCTKNNNNNCDKDPGKCSQSNNFEITLESVIEKIIDSIMKYQTTCDAHINSIKIHEIMDKLVGNLDRGDEERLVKFIDKKILKEFSVFRKKYFRYKNHYYLERNEILREMKFFAEKKLKELKTDSV